MPTLYLILAIIFEAGWAISMKASNGLTKPGPAAVMLVCFMLSAVFLALAAKTIEVGVAYAIWVGCGAAIIAVVGIVHFKEPVTALKLISLGLVLAGVVGLKLSSRVAKSPVPTTAVSTP
jgi:multidrug transporter EmrE-like cation transporter